MKRCAIGGGILALLLAAGIALSFYIDFRERPVEAYLGKAAETAAAGNGTEGLLLAEKAREAWTQQWYLRSCFSPQEEVEQIDCLFEQLPLWAEEPGALASGCIRLRCRVEALGEIHKLRVWNFL